MIVQELGDTRRSRFWAVLGSGLWFLTGLLCPLMVIYGVIILLRAL